MSEGQPQKDQIDEAILRLRALRAQLSGRRREVLERLSGPGTEKEIAQELGMRPNTLHSYVKTIYLILNVHSRNELRKLLQEMEFEPPSEWQSQL